MSRRAVRSLRDPALEAADKARFEQLRAEEEARLKVIADKKKLEAEERRIEREVFRKCGHDLEDVTEERLGLLKARRFPEWARTLMKKGDPRWTGRRDMRGLLKYEKCGGCGLLKISTVPQVT